MPRRRELDSLIAPWTAARSPSEATAQLQALGVPAHPVANSPEMVSDEQLAHRGHFVQVPHGRLGTTWVEGSRARLSRTPAVMWRAGPTFGEDVMEILSGTLGYDEDRIADLAAAGILE